MNTKFPEEDQPRACHRCMWWEPWGSLSGECRRMPPARVGDEGEGFWPLTGCGDWCGEFKLAQPASCDLPETYQKPTTEATTRT